MFMCSRVLPYGHVTFAGREVVCLEKRYHRPWMATMAILGALTRRCTGRPLPQPGRATKPSTQRCLVAFANDEPGCLGKGMRSGRLF